MTLQEAQQELADAKRVREAAEMVADQAQATLEIARDNEKRLTLAVATAQKGAK